MDRCGQLSQRAGYGGGSAYTALDAERRSRLVTASVAQRVGATLADGIVFFLSVPVVTTLIVWFGYGEFSPQCTVTDGVETCYLSPEAAAASRLWFWLLTGVFVLALSAAIHRGRTVGQRATQCRIIDVTTEQAPSFWMALARTGLMLVSAVPFGAGYWWAFTNDERRTWHDLATNTRVTG